MNERVFKGVREVVHNTQTMSVSSRLNILKLFNQHFNY